MAGVVFELVAPEDVEVTFYVVYEKPADLPLAPFAVRRHLILKDGRQVAADATSHPTLDSARASVPKGCSQIPRDPMDDPGIVESWM